ncbi:MAG: hypothetical protein ABIP02_05280 [Arenimonas sp.]
MSLNALFLLPMLAASPYASIDTRDIPAADIVHFQIYIRAVDGKAYLDNPVEKKVEPGVHWIEMTRQKSSKLGGIKSDEQSLYILESSELGGIKSDEQSLYILAKPCTRYYVAGGGEAGEISNTDPKFRQKWKVVVRKEERILDCKTKEDIEREKAEKKAKKAKAAEDAALGKTDPQVQNETPSGDK